MNLLRKSKWLAGILFTCLAVLFCVGTVLADGEVPQSAPEEVPMEEAPPVEEVIQPEVLEVDPAIAVEAVSCNASIQSGGSAKVSSNETAGGDPWWKVGTKTYSTEFPGGCPVAELGTTCWESTEPIQEALYRIRDMGLLPTNRKLYVEAGSFPDTISIDTAGTLLEQLKGIIGVPSVLGNYDSEITGNLYLYGTANGFTLSGFEFTGNVYFNDNNGTLTLNDLYIHDSGFGLRVYNQNGAIKLDQVRIEDNDRYGALLQNDIHATAGVEVTNSSFNFNTLTTNTLHGLEIDTNGAVTINGVSSSYNHGDGLNIEGAKSVTVKNSVFSHNDDVLNSGTVGWGIFLDTAKNGSVLLDHVHAVGNEGWGIDLNTWGKVTFNNVVASENDEGGARIDNCYLNGSVCENSTLKPVVLSNSIFDQNAGDDGVYIRSKGAVTLTTIHTYLNSGDGVYINNCNWYDGACQGNGAVKVSSKNSAGLAGLNMFDWNGGDGLHIYTRGTVNVYNFNAEWNGSDGVYIDNNQAPSKASVTVKSTLKEWDNIIKNNGNKGLDVISYGTIKVDKLISYSNGSTGVELDNDFMGVVKSITVSNVRAEWNGLAGIHADSNAAVTIINSSASYNTTVGLDIDNTGGNGNVVIKSTSKHDQYYFNTNWGSHGIEIRTNGTVKISDADAKNNAADGVHIGDSATTLYSKTTTITRGEFDGNTGHGINIESMGNITLNTVIANENTLSGAFLDNCQLDAAVCQYNARITVAGTDNEFSENGNYGFWARAKGNISLTNVDARNNDYDGLYLSNASTGATGSVVLKTSSKRLFNQLYSNGNFGNYNNVIISSNGPVTIQNTNATYGTAYGISISNPSAGIKKAVKIIRSTAHGNHYGGIYLNTNSNVTLQDTSASANDTWGLYVDTDGSVLVTCTGPLGTCTFNNNDTGDGLEIWAKKSITINKIVANDNGNGSGDHGMDLHNYLTPSDLVPDPIKLTNVSVEGNYDCGIQAMTVSNVSLKTVLARYNGVGVSIGTSTDHVNNATVSGTNLFEDNGEGLRVYADGKVSITNVTAQGQLSGRGLYVISYTEGNVVNIKNVIARFNYDGIYVSSQGSVNLHTVISMSNGTSTYDGDGVVVTMTDEEDTLTIRNSAFIFNTGNGIDANLFGGSPYTNLNLINTYYLGNDSDNDGNADLYVH